MNDPILRAAAPGTRHGGRREDISIDDYLSGRHQRSTPTHTVGALSQWFNQPFDYTWITTYRSMHSLHRVIKSVIGAGVLLYAAASVAMLFSSTGPTGAPAISWVLFVLVVQLAVAVFCFVGPIPGRRGLLMFGLFADLGLASVLITYAPTTALTGCVLFAISGAFFTYFVSPWWLLTHLIFVVTFITMTAIAGYTSGGQDAATTVATAVIVLGAVAGVPVFAHLAWTIVTHDARRAALDPLTGLCNRRGWDDALADLWSRTSDEQHTLAVFLLDIDMFKRVNDRFGHDAGDAVIVLLAQRLAALFGDHGIIARTGGEEFLAAATGDAALVRELIDRIGDVTHNRSDDVPVTASVGVAVLAPESDLWGAGVSIVMRAARVADSMMYRAKGAGGATVMTADL